MWHCSILVSRVRDLSGRRIIFRLLTRARLDGRCVNYLSPRNCMLFYALEYHKPSGLAGRPSDSIGMNPPAAINRTYCAISWSEKYRTGSLMSCVFANSRAYLSAISRRCGAIMRAFNRKCGQCARSNGARVPASSFVYAHPGDKHFEHMLQPHNGSAKRP